MTDFLLTKDNKPYTFTQERLYTPNQGIIDNTTLIIPGAVCKRWIETKGSICPFCAFPTFVLPYTDGQVFPASTFREMYEACIDHATDRLTIFNGGSFFPADEIPLEFQDQVFADVATRDIGLLAVETRPEYFTQETAARMRRGLGDVPGMIMIGLESTDATVRNSKKHLRKAMVWDRFLDAVRFAHAYDIHVFVYVMLGAPGLTESERVADTLRSLEVLTELGVYEMSLSLAFVAPNTAMEQMYQEGTYAVPDLHSALHVMKQAAARGYPLRFGGFDETPPPVALATSGCDDCDTYLKEVLNHHRATGSFTIETPHVCPVHAAI